MLYRVVVFHAQLLSGISGRYPTVYLNGEKTYMLSKNIFYFIFHVKIQVELRKGTRDDDLVTEVMSQLSLQHATDTIISNLSGLYPINNNQYLSDPLNFRLSAISTQFATYNYEPIVT